MGLLGKRIIELLIIEMIGSLVSAVPVMAGLIENLSTEWFYAALAGSIVVFILDVIILYRSKKMVGEKKAYYSWNYSAYLIVVLIMFAVLLLREQHLLATFALLGKGIYSFLFDSTRLFIYYKVPIFWSVLFHNFIVTALIGLMGCINADEPVHIAEEVSGDMMYGADDMLDEDDNGEYLGEKIHPLRKKQFLKQQKRIEKKMRKLDKMERKLFPEDFDD